LSIARSFFIRPMRRIMAGLQVEQLLARSVESHTAPTQHGLLNRDPSDTSDPHNHAVRAWLCGSEYPQRDSELG
jgi:hypothetical protein